MVGKVSARFCVVTVRAVPAQTCNLAKLPALLHTHERARVPNMCAKSTGVRMSRLPERLSCRSSGPFSVPVPSAPPVS